MHKMIIIFIKRNIDKVSGLPDIVLGDIYYMQDKQTDKFTESNQNINKQILADGLQFS